MFQLSHLLLFWCSAFWSSVRSQKCCNVLKFFKSSSLHSTQGKTMHAFTKQMSFPRSEFIGYSLGIHLPSKGEGVDFQGWWTSESCPVYQTLAGRPALASPQRNVPGRWQEHYLSVGSQIPELGLLDWDTYKLKCNLYSGNFCSNHSQGQCLPDMGISIMRQEVFAMWGQTDISMQKVAWDFRFIQTMERKIASAWFHHWVCCDYRRGWAIISRIVQQWWHAAQDGVFSLQELQGMIAAIYPDVALRVTCKTESEKDESFTSQLLDADLGFPSNNLCQWHQQHSSACGHGSAKSTLSSRSIRLAWLVLTEFSWTFRMQDFAFRQARWRCNITRGVTIVHEARLTSQDERLEQFLLWDPFSAAELPEARSPAYCCPSQARSQCRCHSWLQCSTLDGSAVLVLLYSFSPLDDHVRASLLDSGLTETCRPQTSHLSQSELRFRN